MATITITTPAPQDARIMSAVGKRLNLKAADGITPRSATAAEVKQFLLDDLKLMVREVEQATARETAQATITDITPT